VSEPGHLARLVKNRLGFAVDCRPHAHGDRFVIGRERVLELVAFLRRDRDADLALLIDIAGVDRGEANSPRFEVHYQLRSPRLGYRAHIEVQLAEADAVVPSLTPYYRSAETLERELFEMFGIYPDGHPLVSPLLLYPGFVGHPLRKDYRASKQQPLVAVLESSTKPVVIEEGP
jgi:NADH-quinone oxidoreductase subunit C